MKEYVQKIEKILTILLITAIIASISVYFVVYYDLIISAVLYFYSIFIGIPSGIIFIIIEEKNKKS